MKIPHFNNFKNYIFKDYYFTYDRKEFCESFATAEFVGENNGWIDLFGYVAEEKTGNFPPNSASKTLQKRAEMLANIGLSAPMKIP